jgi:hypothetical protein
MDVEYQIITQQTDPVRLEPNKQIPLDISVGSLSVSSHIISSYQVDPIQNRQTRLFQSGSENIWRKLIQKVLDFISCLE